MFDCVTLLRLLVCAYCMVTVVRCSDSRDVTGTARSLQAAKTSRSTESNQSCYSLGLVLFSLTFLTFDKLLH